MGRGRSCRAVEMNYVSRPMHTAECRKRMEEEIQKFEQFGEELKAQYYESKPAKPIKFKTNNRLTSTTSRQSEDSFRMESKNNDFPISKFKPKKVKINKKLYQFKEDEELKKAIKRIEEQKRKGQKQKRLFFDDIKMQNFNSNISLFELKTPTGRKE